MEAELAARHLAALLVVAAEGKRTEPIDASEEATL